MIAIQGSNSLLGCAAAGVDSGRSSVPKLGRVNSNEVRFGRGGCDSVRLCGRRSPIRGVKESMPAYVSADSAEGESLHQISTVGKSTNIKWHSCSVGKLDRQELLQQKGCVIWITGLSGSGKSTLACALARAIHLKGKLTYVLDGDNLRHGLNRDLSFMAEDRVENIRRIGEVAKLFADSGIICIASLISPYIKDRAACRALLPEGDFIEVFMDVPLHVCEARDPKGLYKLARAGKIKDVIRRQIVNFITYMLPDKHPFGDFTAGFTGIDDPYEPPLDCEILLEQKGFNCASPCDMAEEVVSYLQDKGYLEA